MDTKKIFSISAFSILFGVGHATVAAEVPDISDIEINTDVDTTTPQSNAFVWPQLTAAYQVGSSIEKSPEVVSNRFDLRAQWSKLFFGHVFTQVDTKVIARTLGDDARSDDKKHEAQLKTRELFAQAGSESFGIKAGIQPIIWSELDVTSVMDVLTPFDYTEFAFTSPEESRVGQAWLLLDAYALGKWSFAASPAPQTTKYPQGNVKKLLASVIGTDQFELNTNSPKIFKDNEWAIRWKQNIAGSDITLMYADIVSDDPMFTPTQTGFDLRYPRYQIAAAGANLSIGGFLLKAEGAYKFNANMLGAAGTSDVIESAGGIEYNANGAYSLQVELANRYLRDADALAAGNHRSLTQVAGRWSKSFFNDTLSAIYFASYQMQYRDVIHSAGLSYAWTDRLRFDINATIFDIRSNDSPMRFTDGWDQAVFKISYAL